MRLEIHGEIEAYDTGYKHGLADMRERAAREGFYWMADQAAGKPTDPLCDRIRALPLTPEEEKE